MSARQSSAVDMTPAQIRFVDLQGIIRAELPKGTGYDEIMRMGQVLAKQFQTVIRAYQGGLTKLGTFKPK